MSSAVLLDAGPLGRITNTLAMPATKEASEWLERLMAANHYVVIPEIADYEVRRELLRARRMPSVARLDALQQRLVYLPITTAMMRTAAAYWAQAREQGRPTAADAALDADVILAAQAAALVADPTFDSVVVATTNVGHLSRFVDARLWSEVTPDRFSIH